ncbi:mechanosensitive ion channel family protein [Magnetofaba australis]|nr:mechanosensitive ion channel domain-containing protein [Magnetofaba australis]
MIRLSRLWLSLLVLALSIPLAAIAAAEPPPPGKNSAAASDAAAVKPLMDLSSPQQTMRSFLVAIQDADSNLPQRINDALLCLDLTRLKGDEEEKIQERARGLARRLAVVIDKVGVNLADIPDVGPKRLWYFYHPEKRPEWSTRPEIALYKSSEADGWLFTARTLTSVPQLEELIEEQEKDRPQAQAGVAASRATPRATMATFLEAMGGDNADLATAIQTLEPTGQDPMVWKAVAERRAVELMNVMNKIRRVVLSEIPDTPEGEPYVWYNSEEGNIVVERIEQGKHKGEWRFNQKTIDAIGELYEHFADRPIIEELRLQGVDETLTWEMRLERRMPQWMKKKYALLIGWQWVALGLLLVVSGLLRIILPWLFRLLLGPYLRRRIQADKVTLRQAFGSTGYLTVFLLWFLALRYLQLPDEYVSVLLPVLKFLISLSIVLTGYRIVDVLGQQLIANNNFRLTRFDELLVPMLRKMLRMFVILIVVLFILEFWFNQPPSTIIGALGIGGVALALAAQNTLGNFFGSLTVIADRPFGIGDWIVIGNVEGTVEHVGFRSTRVRTFYNSLITIPNSRLVDTHVDNLGERRYRRAKTVLSVTYDTPPDKIDAFCEGVRELIRLHPYTRKDYYHVYLNQFSASSLDILLYMFFDAPDWSTELRERHNLFLDIIRLAHRLGVSFAFPTQTLHIQRDAKSEAQPDPFVNREETPEWVAVNEAAELFQSIRPHTAAPPPPVTIPTRPRSKR